MATKKININVPEDLLAKIDDEADLKHMTRTAYMLNAVTQSLEADAFLRQQPDIKRKLLELQDAMSSIGAIDKDYAGLLGQTKLDL